MASQLSSTAPRHHPKPTDADAAAAAAAASASASASYSASACAGKGKASACAGKGKTSAGAGKGKASATAGAGKGKTSAHAGKGKASADSRKQVVQGYSKNRLVQATVWFPFLKEGQGEIDGLHWDDDKLEKEIDGCLRQLKDNPFVYYGGAIDDESFLFLDEQQLTMLNRRLALCRIRAYEDKYQDMDDETLSGLFPNDDLDANEYYLDYERSFEWYFDDVYCQYADFQDYQRLVLRNTGEYEKWEYYRRTCSTLESDQEYVKFWETLLSTTQLIGWYITRTTCESRIERLFYYHTLKIAAVHPNVYKTLIRSGCIEFRRSLQVNYIWSVPYADFLFEMWKLLTGEKLSFKDALKRLYTNGKHSSIFAIQAEFEPNLHPLKELYKPFLDHIGEKAAEEAHQLIMDYVTRHERQPKTYYDYAKKKLCIAEKIGLIPSSSTKGIGSRGI
ncbi:uncharacterized protein [Lolium perenne]|uniref:uncharacterized protein n=1 Tax=Lolium perenne TaxID=4522 RepID=UPI0021F55546|nr:uncharacterized protein LOC127301504 [Lolium perenne]